MTGRGLMLGLMTTVFLAFPAQADVTVTVTATIDITKDRQITDSSPPIASPDFQALKPEIIGEIFSLDPIQSKDGFSGDLPSGPFSSVIDGQNNGLATAIGVIEPDPPPAGFDVNQDNEPASSAPSVPISEVFSEQFVTNNNMTAAGNTVRAVSILNSFNNNTADIQVVQSAGAVGNQLNVNVRTVPPSGVSAMTISDMGQFNAGNQFVQPPAAIETRSAQIRGSFNGNIAGEPTTFRVIGINQSSGVGFNQINNANLNINLGP